jgi:pyruvate/2-oxoglutarate/acetoin dehydrogenase E1 component
MTVVEHLATVLAELLHADPRRVLLGEDVTEGGMIGLSRVAAADETLAPRLLATPLVPTIMAAHAGGLAVAGRRPIVALPSVGSLLEALAGLRETAALQRRGGRKAPVLFVAPCGPGFNLGADATEGLEAMLTHIPGLRVLCVGQARDAGGMLRAAADFWLGDEPTVLLLPRMLLLQELEEGEPPAFALERPLGGVHQVRKGGAATVFAWGEAVDIALRAVAHSEQDVAVVDVVSLSPLDRSGLVAFARQTGKIVITHAGPQAGGVGAELAALFADEAILHLDAPVLRVTGADDPLRPMDETRALPDVGRLSAAITRVATY